MMGTGGRATESESNASTKQSNIIIVAKDFRNPALVPFPFGCPENDIN
jgi:hypothetical protein